MNKLALFTAAGAALMMVSGAALAQNTNQPSTMGASKSHMGNSAPTSGAKTKKAKKPATGQSGQMPKGGKNKAGQ